MSALLYLAIYVAVGGVAAFVLGRREGTAGARLTTAALAFFAWPLWAPIASFSERPASSSRQAVNAEARIHAALDEALSAVRGTSLAALLPEPTVAAMRASVSRSSARILELEAMAARTEREAAETRARVEQLEREGASGRLSTARVHLHNLEELIALWRAERAALEDLADLCEALRSQLVLAHFTGPSVDGVSELVTELGARVEGLDTALAEVVSELRSP
jgi:hypothetical protein